jgi:4-hydroxybenzoate polyprenyltransferase
MNARILLSKLNNYVRLVRLHRPIGILLLLWPTLWALWLAGNGQPNLTTVLVFVLGVILTRSAGCAINDYADRNFDGLVTRTQLRPIVTGEVSPQEAIGVFLVLSIAAFLLVLTQNLLTVSLAIIAFSLMIIYPFTKRFIHIPQLILGAAFGWAIPMAYAALTGNIPAIAWWLFAAALMWALIYDTEYAMVDKDDDCKIGIKSSAIFFGIYDRLIIGILQISMLILLMNIGIYVGLKYWFMLSLIIALGLSIYQQYLIFRREPKDCFQAFLHNHYFGMTIFIGILLDYGLS